MKKKLIFAIPSLIAAGFAPAATAAKSDRSVEPEASPEPTLLRVFKLDHKYDLAGHRSHSSHGSHRSSSGGGGYTRPQKLYTPPKPAPTPTPRYQAPAPSRAKKFFTPQTYEARPNYLITPLESEQQPSEQAPIEAQPLDGTTSPTPLFDPPTTQSESVSPSSILPSPQAAAPRTLPGNSNKFRKIVQQVQLALYAYGYYTGQIDGIVGTETRAALSKMQSDYGLKITGTVTPETLNALTITAR